MNFCQTAWGRIFVVVDHKNCFFEQKVSRIKKNFKKKMIRTHL